VSTDNGLQAERTAMAWQRTALGLVGVSALLLHLAGGALGLSLVGAVGMLAALFVLLQVEARFLHGHRNDVAESPMGVWAVRGITAATVLLSLGAVVVVLSGGG
jgi:putative membrane protein